MESVIRRIGTLKKRRGLNAGAQVPSELLTEYTRFFKDGYLHVKDGQDVYYVRCNSRSYFGCAWDTKPRATEHKSRITGWVGYWPFSMVGTMINDPLRKLIDFIFTWFNGLYQRMSNYIFRDEVGLN